MGLLVGTGGVWLIALRGSWYYLPGGLMLVLIGLLLLQRSPAALWVHAGLLTATLAWSVWEAGLQAWALVARGDVLCILALVMLMPWFTRGLVAAAREPARQALTAALAAFATVTAVAWSQDNDYGPSGAIAQQAPPLLPTPTAKAQAGARALEGQLAYPLPALPWPPQDTAATERGAPEVARPYRTGEGTPAEAPQTPHAALHFGNPLFLIPQPALVALDATPGIPG